MTASNPVVKRAFKLPENITSLATVASDNNKPCTPFEAKNIAGSLINAPVKKTVLVTGGAGATGGPCEALHYHGFAGMEGETVDLIANWILHPMR
jgi:hypothetical protein